MSFKKYRHIINVSAEHIDARKHVNNVVYLQWCLDAAEAQWEQNTNESLRSKYVWYVISHAIAYKASAFLEEELEVSTWVTKAEGVRSERHYKIVRLKDDKVLVEAQSIWCLLNTETLKPTKITAQIRNLFLKSNQVKVI